MIIYAADPNDYRALMLMNSLFAYRAAYRSSGLTQLICDESWIDFGARIAWALVLSGFRCAAVTASFHRPLLGCPSLDLPEQQLASSTTTDGVVDVRSLSRSAAFAGWST